MMATEMGGAVVEGDDCIAADYAEQSSLQSFIMQAFLTQMERAS